jgi:hypothetical protein
VSLSYVFPGKVVKSVTHIQGRILAPNGLISDAFSLSARLYSCCSEYTFASGLLFSRYIYIHAQSEASSSSSSNLYSALCVALCEENGERVRRRTDAKKK